MSRNQTEPVVGSDWSHCPCCKISYLQLPQHHPACPIPTTDALCPYCAAHHPNPHSSGCPHATGLYPVLHQQLSAGLQCADCETLFQLGDCFVAGKTAILCVGCGWIELGETVE